MLLLIPVISPTTEFYFNQFTIHFATINTASINLESHLFYRFTIHFATINTQFGYDRGLNKNHLQYTLLLLIPKLLAEKFKYVRFTIHFATINT